MLVIACLQGQQLVGIAPMVVTRGRFSTVFPRTELRFIGCSNYASDYLDFIIDPSAPEALDILLEILLEQLKRVNRISRLYSIYMKYFETGRITCLHSLFL